MDSQDMAKELGKRGGQKTTSLYGKEHYSKIGKMKKSKTSTETEPHSDQENKVFCYPVADDSISEDSNTPPVRLVRLYKALADERRLRLLKLLMTRSYTLQEIADEFGVAKTTMHHHLATLRTAGLVRAQADGKFYNLRHDMLSEVSELLDSYLNGKP